MSPNPSHASVYIAPVNIAQAHTSASTLVLPVSVDLSPGHIRDSLLVAPH
jgi:hypothetical protein